LTKEGQTQTLKSLQKFTKKKEAVTHWRCTFKQTEPAARPTLLNQFANLRQNEVPQSKTSQRKHNQKLRFPTSEHLLAPKLNKAFLMS